RVNRTRTRSRRHPARPVSQPALAMTRDVEERLETEPTFSASSSSRAGVALGGKNPSGTNSRRIFMRLLSYNIHKGIGGRDRRYRLDRVIQVIEDQNPDLICLQEVAVTWR